jgi:hypothetical protein
MQLPSRALFLRAVERGGARHHFFVSSRLERPDVLALLGLSSAFELPGFEISIAAHGLPKGNYDLSLVLVTSGASYFCSNGRSLSIS